MIAAKALRIFISIYHLLKNECLSVGTKLTLYKALVKSILTYACPAWEFAGGQLSFESAASATQSSRHHW
jgi:hypothetical protein